MDWAGLLSGSSGGVLVDLSCLSAPVKYWAAGCAPSGIVAASLASVPVPAGVLG